MEVKTHRALGRRLAARRRRRAAHGREAPARRPAVADHRDPGRRRRAAGDRVRRHEHRARPADPGGAARGRPARRPADRARREDGRREQRDAVLRRGAAPDGRRRRDPDPARRTRRSGVPLVDLYGDTVLDVDVKPNRGDALSILGLAREVAAATGAPVRWPETAVAETAAPATAERLVGRGRRPRRCAPRFVGRWVERRDRRPVAGPGPDAAPRRRPAADQQRRRRLELRDARARQAGPHVRRRRASQPAPDGRATIVVRRAIAGERLETLDHVERELTPEMLLITDRDGPDRHRRASWAAPTTEVADATTDVAIESAIFDPVSIRRTAQRLALRSEASSRFEKGQEPRLARIGADRTAQLLAAWAGGADRPRAGRHRARRARAVARRLPARARSTACWAPSCRPTSSGTSWRGSGSRPRPAPGEPVTVALRPEPLIVDAPAATGRGTRTLAALVPTWRRDVSIEADVAEEVARVRGYELTPSVTPDTAMPAFRPSPLEVRELVRETLAGAGLTEVVTTGPRVAPPPRGLRPDEPRAVRRRRAAARRRADHRHEPALARPLGAPHEPARQPARRRSAPTFATAARTWRCSRSARATREPATSRASGGASGSPWSGRRSRRPGTAPRGRTTWTTRRACSSSWPAGWTSARPAYRPESGEAVFHPGRTARADDRGPPACARRRAAPVDGRGLGAPHRRRRDRGRGRDRGPGGGAADARARAGRRASPGGRTGPGDRGRRGDARGRRSRP